MWKNVKKIGGPSLSNFDKMGRVIIRGVEKCKLTLPYDSAQNSRWFVIFYLDTTHPGGRLDLVLSRTNQFLPE